MRAASASSVALIALPALVACGGPSRARDDAADPGDGAVRWVRAFAGPGYPSPRDVALAGGDAIVVGSFQTELELGAERLPAAGADGGDDAFVARFDAAGELRWARAWTGPGLDAARAVGVDGDGNAYVAGTFERRLAVGPHALTAVDSPDAFVVRVSPAGAPEWATAIGGAGTIQLLSVAATRDGGVVAAGFFDGVLAAPVPVETAGMQDAVVVKLGHDGSPAWIWRLGGVFPDYAKAVAVTSAGDVVVAGQFRGEAAAGQRELRAAGESTDLFVASLAADTGEPRWLKSLGGGGTDSADAVAVDAADAILVAGRFDEAVLLGGAPVEPAGGFDVFLAKYDGAGQLAWSRRLGGQRDDTVADLAVAGHALLLAGEFEDATRVGGDPLHSAGRHDGFLARYTGAGAPVWSARLGGAGHDQIDAVALGPDGDAAVLASFEGDASFRDHALSAEGRQAVLLRLPP